MIELLRHGRTGAGDRAVEALGLAHLVPDADRAARAVRVGRRDPDPDEPRGRWREHATSAIATSIGRSATTGSTSTTSATPLPFGDDAAPPHRRPLPGRPVRLRSAARRPRHRRCSRAAIRVDVEGGEHVPDDRSGRDRRRTVASASPSRPCSASRCGARVARRLRIVGAPAVPVLGGIARRLGAISASAPDMRACLRAGQSRRGPARAHVAATRRRHPAALRCCQAMTHAPIVPVAVTPGGPFGTAIGAVAGAVRSARHAARPVRPRRPARRGPLRRGGPRRGRGACSTSDALGRDAEVVGEIVTTDGVRIAYDVWGARDGSPVLMIQGLGMNAPRLGAPARRVRPQAPLHRDRQPRHRSLRRAARSLRPRADGAGRDRGARRRGHRARARRRRVDGRRDRADHRRRCIPTACAR